MAWGSWVSSACLSILVADESWPFSWTDTEVYVPSNLCQQSTTAWPYLPHIWLVGLFPGMMFPLPCPYHETPNLFHVNWHANQILHRCDDLLEPYWKIHLIYIVLGGTCPILPLEHKLGPQHHIVIEIPWYYTFASPMIIIFG